MAHIFCTVPRPSTNHSLCVLPDFLLFLLDLNHPADFSGSRGIETDLEISRGSRCFLSDRFVPKCSTDILFDDIFLSSLSRLYLFSLLTCSRFLNSVEFEPFEFSSFDRFNDDKFSLLLDEWFRVDMF